jgi:hypothetical protein
MAIDWQAIVVTAVALGAALMIVRRFVPARRRQSAGGRAAATPVACDHCETGAKATASAGAKGSTARTQTTPVVSVEDLRASAKRR